MKDFWNERYKNEEWAYGVLPNVYFKNKIMALDAGRILLPAEGEGRNAVYAASLGWSAFAFDQSEEAKKKADKLAKENDVEIDYQIADFSEIEYPENSFDAIALIYVHIAPEFRTAYHKKIATFLKPGGTLILEAFSKSHLKLNSVNEKAGGPKDINMLFSKKEIQSDFDDFDIVELNEMKVKLNEGEYHVGMSSVIRFTGIKM